MYFNPIMNTSNYQFMRNNVCCLNLIWPICRGKFWKETTLFQINRTMNLSSLISSATSHTWERRCRRRLWAWFEWQLGPADSLPFRHLFFWPFHKALAIFQLQSPLKDYSRIKEISSFFWLMKHTVGVDRLQSVPNSIVSTIDAGKL